MDIGSVSQISKEAIDVLIWISAPILLISLAIGLLISLFQALTQIQEVTLTFVPKILVVYTGLIFFMPYMLTKLQIFVDHIVQHITNI